ncbi:MAG: hypothetical protein ABI036_19705 [Fibrobacteria bacterium]
MDTGFYVSPGLSYGGIFRTTDGLASSQSNRGSSSARYIDFLNREIGFALGPTGKCWRTEDGGDTWKQDLDYVSTGKGHQPMEIASIGGSGVLIVGDKLSAAK